MKKVIKKTVLLGLVLLPIIYSCSSDESSSYSENNNSNLNYAKTNSGYTQQYADELFKEYINSNEYLQSSLQIKAFNSKLKGLKIPFNINVSDFLMENISNTEFDNITQAINMWDNIVLLKNTERKKFPGVIDFFKNAELVLVDYVAENYFFPINVVNSTCREDLLDCTKRATRNYQNDIKAALTISNEHAQNNAVAQADRVMLQEIEICGGTYDLCIQN